MTRLKLGSVGRITLAAGATLAVGFGTGAALPGLLRGQSAPIRVVPAGTSVSSAGGTVSGNAATPAAVVLPTLPDKTRLKADALRLANLARLAAEGRIPSDPDDGFDPPAIPGEDGSDAEDDAAEHEADARRDAAKEEADARADAEKQRREARRDAAQQEADARRDAARREAQARGSAPRH